MKELIAIQRDLRCNKSRENKFGGYKYRSCEDIMEAMKPLLLKNECTLYIGDEVIEVGGRIYIKATVTLKNKDGETVEVSSYAREEETKKGFDGAQITGAASSYARKYALNGLFCIDDGRDFDTMDNRDMGEKKYIEERINKATTTAELTRLWNSCDTTLQSELQPKFTKKREMLQGGQKG